MVESDRTGCRNSSKATTKNELDDISLGNIVAAPKESAKEIHNREKGTREEV